MSVELERYTDIFKSIFIFEGFQEQKWLSLYVSYFCSQVICWKISQSRILMLCKAAGGHEAFGKFYSHFPSTSPANIFFCIWSFCSVLFHLFSFNIFPYYLYSLKICTCIPMIPSLTDFHNIYEWGAEWPRSLRITAKDEVLQIQALLVGVLQHQPSVPGTSIWMWPWELCLLYFNCPSCFNQPQGCTCQDTISSPLTIHVSSTCMSQLEPP